MPSEASKMDTNTSATIFLPGMFFVLNAFSNMIYVVFALSKDVVRFFYSFDTLDKFIFSTLENKMYQIFNDKLFLNLCQTFFDGNIFASRRSAIFSNIDCLWSV